MCGVNRVRQGASRLSAQWAGGLSALACVSKVQLAELPDLQQHPPVLLMQDNRAAMVANAAGKEYVGGGKPFAHDPKTVRISVIPMQHSVHAHAAHCCSMICAKTLYPHADGMLHAAQSWINGGNVAGLSQFVLLCEPEVLMRVLSVQQAAVCSQLLRGAYA